MRGPATQVRSEGGLRRPHQATPVHCVKEKGRGLGKGRGHPHHPNTGLAQAPSGHPPSPACQLSPGDRNGGLLARAHGDPTLKVVELAQVLAEHTAALKVPWDTDSILGGGWEKWSRHHLR